MIVVKLMGGMGNQFSQYCVAKHLSMKLGTELRLDRSFYDQEHGPNITKRYYLLDRFNIEAGTIEGEDLESFLNRGMSSTKVLINRMGERIVHMEPFKRPCVYKEKGTGFEPEVLELADDHYLFGYFHCDRYFKDIREMVLHDLTVVRPLKKECVEMIDRIRSTKSVCIHVRRGDFYTNPSAKTVHAVDLTDYYTRSVQMMKGKVKDPHFYIFSDEPEWVRKNLDLGQNSTVVDINTVDEPEQDLRVMSECQNFIIANSSFSWWGAWLSRNEDKTVIAPRQWFLDDRGSQDLCPEEWIRI